MIIDMRCVTRVMGASVMMVTGFPRSILAKKELRNFYVHYDKLGRRWARAV
jgi:hypothetical protein